MSDVSASPVPTIKPFPTSGHPNCPACGSGLVVVRVEKHYVVYPITHVEDDVDGDSTAVPPTVNVAVAADPRSQEFSDLMSESVECSACEWPTPDDAPFVASVHFD